MAASSTTTNRLLTSTSMSPQHCPSKTTDTVRRDDNSNNNTNKVVDKTVAPGKLLDNISPVPDFAKVETVKQCRKFGNRAYHF